MSKPNFKQFLDAIGEPRSKTLITSAFYSLYGHIGANLDERDWDAILASDDVLAASQQGLNDMYTDSDYLLRNTEAVLALGYSINQITYTYQQLAGRLGFVLNREWSLGSAYERSMYLSMDEALRAATADAEAAAAAAEAAAAAAAAARIPTLTTTFDFNVMSSLAGKLYFESGDFITDLAASTNALLGTRDTLTTGRLYAENSEGSKSALTTQYYTLGTTGNDSYDATAAGAQVDYVLAGAGDDVILGGDGDDVLDGGEGADTLTGGAGVDTLTGGGGHDDFVYTASAEFVTGGAVVDLIDGGAGSNSVLISNNGLAAFTLTKDDDLARIARVDAIKTSGPTDQAISITLHQDAPADLGLRWISLTSDTDPSGENRIDISNITPLSEFFHIHGSAGNDVIVGSSGPDAINGVGGSDEVRAGDGDDSINLYGSLNKAYAGAGNDTFWGSDGADELYGEGGNDVFIYAYTAKLVAEGAVVDLISGGEGVDSIELRPTDGGIVIAATDDLDRISSVEKIFLTSGFSDPISITLHADARIDTGMSTIDLSKDTFPEGDNVVDVSNVSFPLGDFLGFTLTGSAGSDTLVGSSNSDVFYASPGVDSISGGNGSNYYVYSATSEFLSDGNAIDSIVGGEDNDYLKISNNDLASFTITKDDSLSRLSSVEGILSNGPTNQPIQVTLHEDALLNTGIYHINFSSDTDPLGANLIDLRHVDTGGYSGTPHLEGSSGIDTLIGSNIEDYIRGNDGNDVLKGGSGNDTLSGKGGNDTLDGQAGVDELDGGAGDDVFLYSSVGDLVSGSAVVDFIKGSDGTDTIAITESDGAFEVPVTASLARITGVEKIIANGAIVDPISLTLHSGALDTGIKTIDLSLDSDATNDNVIDVSNVTFWSDDTPGYTLTGSAGKDDITGSSHADVISGGDGDDDISPGEGSDIVNGGNGNDIIHLSGGDNTVHAGAGDDIVYDIAADDEVYGDDGNDKFQLETGVALIAEGAVVPRISGGVGEDTISLMINENFSISATDDLSRMSSVETIKLSTDAIFQIRIVLPPEARIDAGINTIIFPSVISSGSILDVSNVIFPDGDSSGFTFTGSTRQENFTGSSNADIVTVSDGNDQVNTGDGNDVILFTDAKMDSVSSALNGTYDGEGGDGDILRIVDQATDISSTDLVDFSGIEIIQFMADDSSMTLGAEFEDRDFTTIDSTGVSLALTLSFVRSTDNHIPTRIVGFDDNDESEVLTFLTEEDIGAWSTAPGAVSIEGFESSTSGIYSKAGATPDEFYTAAFYSNQMPGSVVAFIHGGNTYVYYEGKSMYPNDDTFLNIVGFVATSMSTTHGSGVLHIG